MWTRYVILAVALTAWGMGASADVLVTKMGKRYHGKVEDKGNAYRIVMSRTTLTFPKSVVREVITEESVKADYDKLRSKVRTAQDRQGLGDWCAERGLKDWAAREYLAAVGEAEAAADREFLESFAEKLQLSGVDKKARLACLSAIGRLRLKSVLAMDAGAEKIAALEDLARWGVASGCSATSAAANRGILDTRLKLLGNVRVPLDRAKRLIALAGWCREKGLDSEAPRAEALALRLAPNDKGIRDSLGYTWDERRRQWIKPPGFRVVIVNAAGCRLDITLEKGPLKHKKTVNSGQTTQLRLARGEWVFTAGIVESGGARTFLIGRDSVAGDQRWNFTVRDLGTFGQCVVRTITKLRR